MTMRFLVVFILAAFSFVSCKKSKVQSDIDPNCSDTISYQTDILPLITNNCTGCHGTGNTTGYTFTNHTNMSSNATNMLNAMRGQGGMQLMPPNGSLSDTDIQKFNCWINQGKLNN
jgi:hypothetical protein